MGKSRGTTKTEFDAPLPVPKRRVGGREKSQWHKDRAESTSRALLAAAQRILDGDADPRYIALEKENIWKEAKAKGAATSRATLWRYPDVIEYFETEKKRLEDDGSNLPALVIARLERELAELRESTGARIRELEQLNDQLAQQVQVLTLDRAALPGSTLVALPASEGMGVISFGRRRRGKR